MQPAASRPWGYPVEAGRRVLLVEPDPGEARSITAQLIDLRLEVIVRGDGTSAIEALEGPPPAAILCETVMPGVDGHTVLQAVIDRDLGCPVVLMGAGVEVSDVLEAWREGAADFLPKPFSRRQLRDCLRRAWTRRGERLPRQSSGPRPAVASAPPAEAPAPPAEAPASPAAHPWWGPLASWATEGALGLPVAPVVLKRIGELTTAEAPDPAEVFELMEADAQLGRAALRLAATAEFRGREAPGSVREAVARLGAPRALAGAATAVHRANYGVEDRALAAVANKLWLAHFVRAVTAESLAAEVGHPRPEQLRTLSLFADVGELMLLRAALALWPEHLAGGQPSEALRSFAVDHARRLSALLLADWGLPTRYVVLARHAPNDDTSALTTEDRAHRELLAGARHLADAAVGPGVFPREPVPAGHMVTVPTEVGAEVTRTAIARVRSMIYA